MRAPSKNYQPPLMHMRCDFCNAEGPPCPDSETRVVGWGEVKIAFNRYTFDACPTCLDKYLVAFAVKS